MVMAITKLLPCGGINTVADDDDMTKGGKSPLVYARDAVNVNISKAGMIDVAESGCKVSSHKYKGLWQSPIHGDVFAILGDSWVIVDKDAWSSKHLFHVGRSYAYHMVLNNKVCLSTEDGIFCYDGSSAVRLTIETPPPPSAPGKHRLGRSIAITWLRGGTESAASSYVESSENSIDVSLPLVTDPTVTAVNIYCTSAGGGDMQLAATVSPERITYPLTSNAALGRALSFSHLSPMPSGRYLSYWRGRIVTASANVLRFSEPMAYHLHDERHGFIQMPQRITFIQPVGDGLWIGQVDSVVFLQGSGLSDMAMIGKSGHAPVPDSAISIDSNEIGELSLGGDTAALWLSSNGYVVGNSLGQMVEVHAGKLDGIAANRGTTVRLGRRLVTSVN